MKWGRKAAGSSAPSAVLSQHQEPPVTSGRDLESRNLSKQGNATTPEATNASRCSGLKIPRDSNRTSITPSLQVRKTETQRSQISHTGTQARLGVPSSHLSNDPRVTHWVLLLCRVALRTVWQVKTQNTTLRIVQPRCGEGACGSGINPEAFEVTQFCRQLPQSTSEGEGAAQRTSAADRTEGQWP